MLQGELDIGWVEERNVFFFLLRHKKSPGQDLFPKKCEETPQRRDKCRPHCLHVSLSAAVGLGFFNRTEKLR